MGDKLTINKRFAELLPRLSKAEYEQLEANLLKDGRVREKIVIWKDQIIDGHHRYELAEKHGLPYDVHVRTFASEEEACDWIADHQLGRRNINDNLRKYLIGRKYRSAVQKQGGTRNGSGRKTSTQTLGKSEHKSSGQIGHLKKPKGQNGVPKPASSEVAEAIAAETQTSARTVRRSAKESEYVDRLADGLRERWISGELTLTAPVLEGLASLSHDDQLKVARDLRVGHHARWQDAIAARGVKVKGQKPVSKKPSVNGTAQLEAKIEDTIGLLIRQLDEWFASRKSANSKLHKACLAGIDAVLKAVESAKLGN